jgi:two-component system chemotaxis sensor kinase CheA
LTRLFISHRLEELEEMSARFSIWRHNHSMISGEIDSIRKVAASAGHPSMPNELIHPLKRIAEFLDYDRDFVRNLQHDLGTHIRETAVDRAAIDASMNAVYDLIHDAILIPASVVLASFPSMVRKYSRDLGKDVDLIIEGGEIEVDRRILESLKDPLMHLVHNSIDHGIELPGVREKAGKSERGTVRFRIVPIAGSKVRIEVFDDGEGIDPELLRQAAVEKGVISADEACQISDEDAIWLIFKSGLSTSTEITGISGRGLGMAIVEDTVTRLGGTVRVSSGPSRGTTITLQVPIRMATLRGVVVRSGGHQYVIPMQQVRHVARIREENLSGSDDQRSLRVHGEEVGVVRLDEVLETPVRSSHTGGTPGMAHVVVIAYGAGQIACIVDEVLRVQDIVARPLGSQLKRIRKITGAVILGDGRIALLLDPPGIIQEALRRRGGLAKPDPGPATGSGRILVVEDSVTSRALLQGIFEQAGFFVLTAKDGAEAFAMLKEYRVDIVVSDVDMPRMSGITLTEKIRADPALFKIPVVLIPSLDNREDRRHGINSGANAYIVKSSFEKGDIVPLISDLIRSAADNDGQ